MAFPIVLSTPGRVRAFLRYLDDPRIKDQLPIKGRVEPRYVKVAEADQEALSNFRFVCDFGLGLDVKNEPPDAAFLVIDADAVENVPRPFEESVTNSEQAERTYLVYKNHRVVRLRDSGKPLNEAA